MCDDSKNDTDSRPEYFDYRQDQELIAEERKHLRRRADKPGHDDSKLVGLALSGGGIRSSSFALGVLQALSRNHVLNHVDYLSTVSGGGYIGSSLSWFLHKQWSYKSKNDLRFGVEPENFPFGTRPNTDKEDFKAGSQEKMSILRHLRQNLNYLFPGNGTGPASLFAALTRGLILNILIYGPVLVLLLILAAYAAALPVRTAWLTGMDESLIYLLAVACAVAAFTVPTSLFYGIFCSIARRFPKFLYCVRRFYLRIVGALWIAVGLLLILGSLQGAIDALNEITNEHGGLGSSGITLGGILSGFWAYIRNSKSQRPKIKIPTGLIVMLSAALLIYGGLMLAYMGAESLFSSSNSLILHIMRHPLWLLLIAMVPIIIGSLINVNYVTMHRYYRDRLMELFMPVPRETTITQPARPAATANGTYLHEICHYRNGAVGPYHLINANIILPGSKVTRFRGRGGDNFLLSPLYCGSNATGWISTDKFIGGKMTLATAMAISGAAVNPNTGACGEGPTRNPLLSAIMTLLNIRLGVWVENPNPVVRPKCFQPNLWLPGLRDVLLPTLMNETSKYVELSDGGHFENLAVYELIRREVDLIILCDGAADKDYKFKDFANLVEKVRLDFGARIDINLDPIIPKTGEDLPYGLEKIAEQGHAIGTIRYQTDKKGVLIYMKTTLMRHLPADIYGYKLTHEHFPDETTGDQFFDERQFEAYRELGYQVCVRMLDALPPDLEKLSGRNQR